MPKSITNPSLAHGQRHYLIATQLLQSLERDCCYGLRQPAHDTEKGIQPPNMADVADAAPAQAPSSSQDEAAAQPEVSAASDDLSDVTNRLSELMTKPAAE